MVKEMVMVRGGFVLCFIVLNLICTIGYTHAATSKKAVADDLCKRAPPIDMKLVSPEACIRGNPVYDSVVLEYKGEVTVSGRIVVEDDMVFAPFAWFDSKQLGHVRFWGAVSTLTNRLKLPDLSNEVHCWAADAVLKVRRLKIIEDYTDAAGTHVTDFELVKIGKYRQCKAANPPATDP